MAWSMLDAQGISRAAPLPAPAHDLDGDGCVTVLDVQLVSARIGGITNIARASAFDGAVNALAGDPLTMGTQAEEWLAYDVNVPAAGDYVFTFRYAASSTPRKVRIEINGVDVTGTILLPPSGGYETWADASSLPVALPTGAHTIRLVLESGGPNLNYFTVSTP